MDPNPNLTMPTPELPSPVQPEAVPSGNEKQPLAPETAGVAAEQAPAPSTLPAMPLPTQPDPVLQVLPTSNQPLPAAPIVDLPEIAEDNDLIEQEWVHKAKEIVERTRSDPHEQNKEINKVKADYIKKRYNREIKVNEG